MEQVARGRSMGWRSADELNWDALYADPAPRVYNYFRYRLETRADVECLIGVTFAPVRSPSR